VTSIPVPVTRAPGRQGGIIGGLQADLVPFQSGQLDVAAQEAAQLRAGLSQLGPFGGRYQQVGAGQLGQPADMVLVQVRQDRCADSGGGISEGGELGGEGVGLADVEPGEPVIQVAR
jgi:hypothetical protein